MATTASGASSATQLKQIKATPTERINGKIKLTSGTSTATTTAAQAKQQTESNAASVSAGARPSFANAAPNGTGPSTATKGPQPEGSPEQRRRVSGRANLTPEEQKMMLRRRVEQFIPTIAVRNSTTNILAKYKDATPSFIIHLHPTHFRFDQQEGVFSYNSPMKALLEYIRDEQIPHEVADIFKLARIKYYDGCLIVEVRDHRPKGQPVSTSSRGGPFITPSQNAKDNTPSSRSQSTAPPAPKEKEPPRVYRTLLRPTEQSLWQDFGQLAETSSGECTDWMCLQVEGGLMLAMHPRLILDCVRPGMSRKRIFDRVFDKSNLIPPRKKVKRESSKALDDSAERAAEERLMLLGATRHDKDFQPRFSILTHREEWRKKQAEEEKNKAAAVNSAKEFGNVLHTTEAMDALQRVKPKPVATMESIQAQHGQSQAPQQPPPVAQPRLPQVANGIIPRPAPTQIPQQLSMQQTQFAATQVLQGAAARRPALPRAGSHEQLVAQRVQQTPTTIPRQLQPTGVAPSNAPTPISSSPQVPIQRLPATPRNIPGTPHPPGTPQPQPAQKPTPQPNTQVMTPASSQASPMLKSASQSDEQAPQLTQVNSARPPFPIISQTQMVNGMVSQQPQRAQLPLPFVLQILHKLTGHHLTPEQWASLEPNQQTHAIGKVQEELRRMQTQNATAANNPQMRHLATPTGVQNPAYPPQQQAAQNFLQAQQAAAAAAAAAGRSGLQMPIQPMTPEQQRLLAQAKQQFLSATGDASQIPGQPPGPMNADQVRTAYQQTLLARNTGAANQGGPQQPPNQQAALQARQLAAMQQAQVQAQGLQLKLPAGQHMTAQQAALFRNRTIQQQAARNAQQPQNIHHFMASLSPADRAQFQNMDAQRQAGIFHNWMHNKAAMIQAQQAQQAQQQQGGQGNLQAPLQYNPMAAQSMGMGVPGRVPVGMAQGQVNGVNGPTMMRQSTGGGNA